MAGRFPALLLGVLIGMMPAGSATARTLDDVRSAGVVTCGLDVASPGFSKRAEGYVWTGFYVDLCRALAAAVFSDPMRTRLVAIAPDESVIALQSGEIDVLMETRPMQSGADGADGLIWALPFYHQEASGLSSYAPVVRQGDDQWLQVVRDVEFALIRATEQGLTQAGANALLEMNPGPDTDRADHADNTELAAFGFSRDWQLRVVAAVGNHAEILRRNLGPGSDTGLNAIWSRGGLHWSPR